MEDSSLLLDVKNVSVDYAASSGATHAVNQVSLQLHRGEILGLAGESGSGKSTLAYAISRLLQPPAIVTEGEVLYFSRSAEDPRDCVDLFELSSEELRKLR